MTRNYIMLGKVYQINTIDSVEGNLLHEELGLYPLAEENAVADLIVNYLDNLVPRKPLLRNPSKHSYYEDGFRLELINVKIDFLFSDKILKQIDFCIKQGSFLMAELNKWFSYQFTNRKESIGYLFHELVLVPSAFFFPELTVIHASAIDDDGVVLFGGTGGVGKTSLELELCTNLNKSFFADDIVFANNKGLSFPNLSYPKLYGYNLTNNDELKAKIFKNAGVLNKIHWHSRKSINPSIVRRRINPVHLYNNVEQHPKKIKTFYILIKDGSTEKIKVSNISAKEASKLNRLVIETEYHIFYKHLLWDEFNSVVLKKDIRLGFSELMTRIESNLYEALENIDCFIVKIPINISHKEYLSQISKVLNIKPTER